MFLFYTLCAMLGPQSCKYSRTPYRCRILTNTTVLELGHKSLCCKGPVPVIAKLICCSTSQALPYHHKRTVLSKSMIRAGQCFMVSGTGVRCPVFPGGTGMGRLPGELGNERS